MTDNPIRVFLRRQKEIYLDGAPEGGTASWFKEWFHQRAIDNPDVALEVRTHVSALVDLGMDQVWREHEGPEPDDDSGDGADLFTVAGMATRKVYRIKDPDVPGGYRAIARRHANISHSFAQAEIILEQAGMAFAAGNRLMAQSNEMLRRAGGNGLESIINVRDGAPIARGTAA